MHYSPILGIATAAFEIMVALWALTGPGRRDIVRITSAVLLLLAGYQLTEVLICAADPVYGFLPRLAFIDVTWLPPLGILLCSRLFAPRSRFVNGAAYAMLAAAGGIMIWIAADPGFVSASVCSTVFARYSHAMPRFQAYAGFYWIGLLGMVGFSAYGAKAARDANGRRLFAELRTGSVGFIVPSLVTTWFVPTANGALPSIMCHFALLLAVFLTRLVAVERKLATATDSSPVPQAE
jgi:hypothetical protein